jgi:hypothetical protein
MSDNQNEVNKLGEAIDSFAFDMKDRLFLKVHAGRRSWDTVSSSQLRAGMDEKIKKYINGEYVDGTVGEAKLLVDIANFSMMIHKAIGERR